MKNNMVVIILLAVVTLALFAAVANPYHAWMSQTMSMVVASAAAAAGAGLCFIIITQQAQDERERLHAHLAGRFAFFVGAVILTVGMLVESYRWGVDPWIVWALAGMIAAETIGLVYSRLRK